MLAHSADADVARFFAETSLHPHLLHQQVGLELEQRKETREACAACLVIICSPDPADVLVRENAKKAFLRFGGQPIITST